MRARASFRITPYDTPDERHEAKRRRLRRPFANGRSRPFARARVDRDGRTRTDDFVSHDSRPHGRPRPRPRPSTRDGRVRRRRRRSTATGGRRHWRGRAALDDATDARERREKRQRTRNTFHEVNETRVRGRRVDARRRGDARARDRRVHQVQRDDANDERDGERDERGGVFGASSACATGEIYFFQSNDRAKNSRKKGGDGVIEDADSSSRARDGRWRRLGGCARESASEGDVKAKDEGVDAKAIGERWEIKRLTNSARVR